MEDGSVSQNCTYRASSESVRTNPAPRSYSFPPETTQTNPPGRQAALAAISSNVRLLTDSLDGLSCVQRLREVDTHVRSERPADAGRTQIWQVTQSVGRLTDSATCSPLLNIESDATSYAATQQKRLRPSLFQ
ncbi:hypothetical protein BD414DRAFT_263135 [Trametes punicea]|nr:hypothetical protein BD414DRAFT_263135 [Trametes punicea]